MYQNNNRSQGSFGNAPRSSSRYGSSRPSTGGFRGGDRSGSAPRFGGGRGGGGGRRVKVLDPQLFVRRAVESTQEVYVAQHTFADFAFDAKLKENIARRGYVTPTPIQDQTIPLLLEGKDVIGIANTGTGKTAAFLLPLINKLVTNKNDSVLIIAPTRELAVQIDDEFREFSRGMGMFSALCIGGVSISNQIRNMRRNPHFVIATPGRLKDLEMRHAINFAKYNSIVLDEVDRMLDMGFVNAIRDIIAKLPQERHSLFFSATLPSNVKDIMSSFLKDPITVSINSNKTTNNVDQDIVRLNGKNKLEVLHDLLITDEVKKTLIFGRTKWGIEKLSKELLVRGFKVDALHGNKSQFQRQKALDAFKDNRIDILIATDIASRGLDIDDITHVINFDAPESYEDYIHRIGRTGRANKKGIALTFV